MSRISIVAFAFMLALGTGAVSSKGQSGKSHVSHEWRTSGVLVGVLTENCQGVLGQWGTPSGDDHFVTGHQCFNSEQCDGQWVYIDNTGPWCVNNFTAFDH